MDKYEKHQWFVKEQFQRKFLQYFQEKEVNLKEKKPWKFSFLMKNQNNLEDYIL
jgi:hypothetical protein